jgi:rhamnosyltransferase
MKIVSVTITYQPDLTVLRTQLDTLLKSNAVVVIDNGSAKEIQDTLLEWAAIDPRINIKLLDYNQGLAAAQNMGIAVARKEGCTHVMLMDQDSLPASDMVLKLKRSFLNLEKSQSQIAAVGPCYYDPVLRNPPDFVKLKWWGYSRYKENHNQPLVKVDHLISSGCLFSIEALIDVGGMQEGLFIDFIDIEWGMRANLKGWALWGVFEAKMKHSLGPRVIQVFWRRIPLHSPLRHYFVTRNAIWLFKSKSTPLMWRFHHMIKLPLRLLIYLIFGDLRVKRLKLIVKGILDGLSGNMGKPSWI